MPGSVHDALLAAGKLPDAHVAYNEIEQIWVGSKTWCYTRTFLADESLLAHRSIELICEGLDTLCTILINHQPIGRADNMFRSWRFNAKPYLQLGNNQIELRFEPASTLMEARAAERMLPAWNELAHTKCWGPTGRGYIRKQACQFGWDWGPQCPSAGPWLPLRLEARTGARIEDWHHSQTHHPDGRVTLAVHLRPNRPDDLIASARLSLYGRTVAQIQQPFFGGWEWNVTLEHPALWWPHGMGEQPLYTLDLHLASADCQPLDFLTRQIGLRRLELVRQPDVWGRSFYFQINGRPFFAKGSNWIPLDAHPSSQNLEPRYRRDLLSARQAHMNLLRVWGGGYFSHDIFYDLCDELGILVWQDLMFGCGTYPTWDADFLESVWRETVDAAKRLRHHACLACWCGNNELEQGFTAPAWQAPGPDFDPVGTMAWSSYLDLFERILPSALTLADPETTYLRGSPHCAPEDGRNSSTDRSGDLHIWEIWFSPAPFENYRNYHHRFLSEFGFQSLPDATTLAHVAPPHEPLSIDSPWLRFRQRSQPGNARILEKTAEYFGPLDRTAFSRLCTLTQITQGLALKTGIETWRSRFPRCGGATYWQLNDRWAAPTWATLDHLGHWKASHYLVRAFFAPLIVVGIENRDTFTVDCFLINDHPTAISGTFSLTAMLPDGTTLTRHTISATALPQSQPTALGTFHIPELCPYLADPANVLIWLEFLPDQANALPVSNLVLFCRPFQLHLQPAQLDVALERRDAALHAHIRNGPSPALFVHPTISGYLLQPDDNFFHLRPGQEKSVRIPIPASADADQVADQLRFETAP